ncbi:MAG: gamma-glutamylcyclotransferase [Roseovarius sp.]|nr:gamma-glutamylcyclotransferase [Roseovarius sp.]MBK44168.1 gamma-glutamylcyclotransferase [Roseovarius sp.]|tara:strand:- start:36 stop:572 length:537 start_codon:yes stop_codon:yes gene_type:complete
MTFLYFAFGSNMLSNRLIARCPSAKLVGKAFVQDHALEFTKKSVDGSGKATLIERTGVITPGVLFEIETAERDALDRFEGAGKGYDRIDTFEVVTGHDPVTAATYLASESQADLLPFDWYLATVVAGSLEHGLGEEHAAKLRATRHKPDDRDHRKSRVEAIEALRAHGHSNYLDLLDS